LDENKLDDGVFIGPDIVMIPPFHIIGKCHQVPFENSVEMIPELGRQFLENERKQIKKPLNPDIFIGLTRNINWLEKYSEYTTAVQVENLKDVPQGFNGITFETSICARFRYIGQPSYFSDINKSFAYMMYNTVKKYTQNKQAEYVLVKIDTRLYDETYCQIEWYTPVSEKQ